MKLQLNLFPLHTYKPHREKKVFRVSDQVRHKPVSAVTEDDWRLEILDLESRGNVLSV